MQQNLRPNESTYWRLLAVFCAENGVHLDDVGLPAAQKAVDLAPDDPSALDALGWAYLSSGRYANAEQILLDVIKRFPDHLPAHIHLAMTYLAQGNRAAALDKLIYVQSTDPNGARWRDGKAVVETVFSVKKVTVTCAGDCHLALRTLLLTFYFLLVTLSTSTFSLSTNGSRVSKSKRLKTSGVHFHDLFAGETHFFVGIVVVAVEGERLFDSLVNDEGRPGLSG